MLESHSGSLHAERDASAGTSKMEKQVSDYPDNI